MQRVSSTSDGDNSPNYFPAGLMGSSDARYIIEAINAAVRMHFFIPEIC